MSGGLCHLTLLFFCDIKGGSVKWQETSANGTAPRAIWHHQCAPFEHGSRVAVFGGDFPQDDPEYVHIDNRRTAGVVYILDVAGRNWDRLLSAP